MTVTALTAPSSLHMPRSPGVVRRLCDVLALTKRNLVHIAREPLQLSDVTVQPVLFTLLFVYVFGAGVVLAGGQSYADFAIAGLLAFSLTTSAMGTGVGLSTDLNSGVIDRLGTLPMWRPAVLVSRSITDLLTSCLCALMVAITGLCVGWRPTGGVGSIAAGFAIFLLFAYALSWGCACLGLVSKGPESALGMGLVILFPLAIVSNVLVPTQHMPAVIRAVADWNPVSAVGGGSILAPILIGAGWSPREVAPATLASTFVTSVVGVATFMVLASVHGGSVAPNWGIGVALGAGGIFGSYLGARIQPRLPEDVIRRILGGIVTAIGAHYAWQAAEG